MQFFYLHYSGNICLPFYYVNTDDQGDYIHLGQNLEQLNLLIKDQKLRQVCRFLYEKVNEANRYASKVYLADVFPPEITKGNSIYSAFPYRDTFIQEDENEDEEIVEEWGLVDPNQHPYARLYEKLNPEVLIGVIEVIHHSEPSMISDLYRCPLVGFNYIFVDGKGQHDNGYYFLTRHLVVLRKGDEVSFNSKLMDANKPVYYGGIRINYDAIKYLLSK